MRPVSIIFSVLLALLVVGCAPFKPVKTVPADTYTLSSVGLKKYRSRPTHLTLLVTVPNAAPGYTTDKMIYTLQPYQLNAFSMHRWIAPPAHMLLPLLTQTLRNTNYFHAVVASPYSGVTSLRLNSQLLQLQQDFITSSSYVKMTLQVELINNATSQVIASKRFTAQVIAPENNPYAGVIAANQATAKILQQVAAFVIVNSRKVLRRHI